MPVTYLRPGLSPTGPVYMMHQGTKTFVPPLLKNGNEKRTRKKSTKDHMIFAGGPWDGVKWLRLDYHRAGNKKVDHFPGFDPLENPNHRVVGDRTHAGWYIYDPETDRMEWSNTNQGET